MADKRNYYVLCENNCKFPAMTKEQILSAIEQAVSTGEIKDVDTGFVTKIKELNANTGLSFWIGTQAQYNALTEKVVNCLYIVTDDTSGDDLESFVEELNEKVTGLETAVAEIPRNRILYENANGYVASVGEQNTLTNAELVDAMLKYNHIALDISCDCFDATFGYWKKAYKTITLQRIYSSGHYSFVGSFARDVYNSASKNFTTGTMLTNILIANDNALQFIISFANGVEYAHIEGEGSEGDVTIFKITGIA